MRKTSTSMAAWQPKAQLAALRARAEMLERIRTFFKEREVLEVETPLLGRHAVTDVHIESFPVSVDGTGGATDWFLQTSPEYHMKRLLARDGEAIFQITRSFRRGERGASHNPEFTILEWYRPGFDHHQLMDEVDELLRAVLTIQLAPESLRTPWHELFAQHTGLAPFVATPEQLAACALDHNKPAPKGCSREELLQWLFTQLIEPQFPPNTLQFVHAFPEHESALARLVEAPHPELGSVRTAARFEAYIGAVELANGFWELTDPQEQRARFCEDQARRAERGLAVPAIDEAFLAALESGLPDCAGVALGLDRLLMLELNAERIQDVLLFPADLA